jgi:TrmH family RNA methyltransferase
MLQGVFDLQRQTFHHIHAAQALAIQAYVNAHSNLPPNHSQLVLVDPQCEVDEQTLALAAGAGDIAENATIVSTLDEAVKDCGLVVGSSARSRTLEWPMLEPRECGEKFAVEGQKHPVALVFGRERTGLTNDELQKCHYHASTATERVPSRYAGLAAVPAW